MRRLALPAGLCWLAGWCALVAAERADAAPKAAAHTAERTVLVERALPAPQGEHAIRYRLLRDRDGRRGLARVDADGTTTDIACDPLEGAWGLWIEDVDGDRSLDAVIALRKTARFDPVLENRLHVYALVGDRCVPMWRGTRLAGRFDTVNPSGGTLLALERIGKGRRRVARYRWTGFGYALDETLWVGTGDPPKRLRRKLGQ